MAVFKIRNRNRYQAKEKGRAKIQKFTTEESDIVQRLNQADRALNRSRKRTANLSREIDRLDKMIAEMQAVFDEVQ